MSRLVLVRHGQTDWNVAGRLQGASDIPLNETGRAQARAARPGLWAELRPNPVVVASHLDRAIETARILCEGMGIEVQSDARFGERAYGVWEGLGFQDRADAFPGEVERWRLGHEPRIDGYETHAELAVRVREGALAWMAAVPEGSDLVVISHGSAGRMLLLELLGLPLVGRTLGHLENCAWSRIVRRSDGQWSLERHNVGAPAIPGPLPGA